MTKSKAIVLTEEELYGHEQDCSCQKCITTREFQLCVRNSKVTDAFWRGLHHFHATHNIPIEQYLETACLPCKSVRAAYMAGMYCAKQTSHDMNKVGDYFKQRMTQFRREEERRRKREAAA